MSLLGPVLIAALAYFVCGKLGIYLAIPPGYATAVWPSSGVALAMAVRFGSLSYPGTWLGSFLINASISHAFAQPTFTTFSVPALIACGAVAQAALGRHLIARHVPHLWSSAQSIMAILLMGGPLSCLLAATSGVTTLLLYEQITTDQYLDIWLTWWVGDSLGVLTFAPALLVLLVHHQRVSLAKRLTVVAPLVITFLLVTLAYNFVRDFEQQQHHLQVEKQLEQIRNRLERELQLTQEIGEWLESSFSEGDLPDWNRFQRLTHYHKKQRANLRALEWVPYIRADQRETFEASMQAMGLADYRIREWNADGHTIPAGERAEYFPVAYINPLHGNEAALGVDLGSNPERLQTLQLALAKRDAVLSHPTQLIQVKVEEPAYLLMDPVVADEAVRGFVVLIFLPRHLAASVIRDMNLQGLFFTLVDATRPQQPEVLLQSSDGMKDYRATTTLPLLNRSWQLSLTPSIEFLQQVPHWQSYAVLFAGWPFIMVLSVLLILLNGRQLAVEKQVQDKTAELEAASARAQQASRAKTDFLANMSHELRTPLNSIIGFTHQVLRKKSSLLDERSQESLHTVERNAHHLLALINDLLDINKIEAGRMELSCGRFNVRQLCLEVAASFRQQALDKNLLLRVEVDPALELEADRLRIYQVLLNLVSNAIKFTSQGGIQILAQEESRSGVPGIRISVKDSGIGIAPELQSLLFSKFVQLEAGKQARMGTGLGLALVKEIVQLHQGDVALHSDAGQGSTFSLWLPQRPAAAQTAVAV